MLKERSNLTRRKFLTFSAEVGFGTAALATGCVPKPQEPAPPSSPDVVTLSAAEKLATAVVEATKEAKASQPEAATTSIAVEITPSPEKAPQTDVAKPTAASEINIEAKPTVSIVETKNWKEYKYKPVTKENLKLTLSLLLPQDWGFDGFREDVVGYPGFMLSEGIPPPKVLTAEFLDSGIAWMLGYTLDKDKDSFQESRAGDFLRAAGWSFSDSDTVVEEGGSSSEQVGNLMGLSRRFRIMFEKHSPIWIKVFVAPVENSDMMFVLISGAGLNRQKETTLLFKKIIEDMELKVIAPLKLIPTRIEVTDRKPPLYGPYMSPIVAKGIWKREVGKKEEGWKWVSILYGFENTSDEWISISRIPDRAVLSTREAFDYPPSDQLGDCGYHLERLELPPKFRVLGVWQGLAYGFLQEAIFSQRCFRIGELTTPIAVRVHSFPGIDLVKEGFTDLARLKFPTDRPDSDFQEFGDPINVSKDVEVVFTSVQEEDARHYYNKEAVYIVIKVLFKNKSLGKENNVSVNFRGIFADDGIFYFRGSRDTFWAGPGLSKQFEVKLFMPRKGIKGKLIVSGDINEIFNLR